MPIKGRKYGKRKGGMRRKNYRRRALRKLKMVHHFKEMFRTTDITIPAGSTANGVLSCSLSQLVNQANFTGLFDLYKITGVKWRFLYKFNSADTASTTVALPTLYTAINRDPFVPAPVTIGDILNDDTCRIHRCDGLVGKGGIYIKSPKPDMTGAVVVEGNPTGGIVTQQWQLGTSSRQQYWLTTGGNGQALDQSGVKHYGLRYFADNTSNLTAQVIEVYATLYFSMKEQD